MTGAAFAYDNSNPASLDQWPLIASLHDPDDVKRLDSQRRQELASEIRDFLIDHVSATGGHLGVNLGVVELTIALHTVFNSPDDAILFDTGHQCYVHKILTGRAAGFRSLRQSGGLSGYPSRTESAHDWVESSHASSALAYADGLAKGFRLQGERDRRVVAVIGDGGLTGGLAWEGLNNIGANNSRVVIVVNDNGRSYAPTVGGLCRPGAGGERSRMAAGDTFRALGFEYVGPIDGHDLGALDGALTAAAEMLSPVVVHCVTVKGKGYEAAERDARDRMHAIGIIDPRTGRPAAPTQPTWTGEFSREIVRLASQRPDLVTITAAMLDPVGLTPFAEAFPDRVFDVGIAEQHAVASAAGLAMSGLHPVVCLYSTFLSRAVDQILMDVALHRLPVTFVVDRAGITGPDGASHHGMWDTALCTAIPGVRIASPRDAPRLRELLADAVGCDGPTVIRFPRGSVGGEIEAVARVDGFDVLRDTTRDSPAVLIVSAGPLASECVAAADLLETHGVSATVVDPRWTQPINPGLLSMAARYELVVTVEDAVRGAGMGTALMRDCSDAEISTPFLVLGLSDEFIEHGDRPGLLREQGLDSESIAECILDRVGSGPRATPPIAYLPRPLSPRPAAHRHVRS